MDGNIYIILKSIKQIACWLLFQMMCTSRCLSFRKNKIRNVILPWRIVSIFSPSDEASAIPRRSQEFDLNNIFE